MEGVVAESSETNSLGSSLSELEKAEIVKGASEVEKTSNDKELSWEKIAAEIAADEEEIQPQTEGVTAEIPLGTESTAQSETVEKTVQETVINSATEEKPTETNSSEVVADSTEAQSEETISETSEEIPKEPVISEETIKEATLSEEIVNEPIIPNEEIVKNPELATSEDLKPNEEATPTSETEIVTSENFEPTEEVATPLEQAAEPSELSDTLPVDEVIEAEETVATPPKVKLQESPETSKELIEISELKSDQGVTETLDELEYTVLEAEDVETYEKIEEHLAQTNKGVETVVIINPDQSQTEITIEQLDDDDRADESQTYAEEVYLMKENEAVDDPQEGVKEVKVKKQRGRKPIADIPLHVLGRDISKPTEGVSNGGRTMPKPRLGVKVPYRNLTSQIVSKQEIEKEIMERFKLKQEQNITNSGDILFARKLTQRLAKKLIPTEKEAKDKGSKEKQEAGSSVQNDQGESDIKNNSDLLAILEGDGDDIEITKQKKQASDEEKKKQLKRTEKEIALEQLKELPGQKTIYKGRNEEERKVKTSQKDVEMSEPAPPVASPLKESKANIEKKHQMDVEPRLRTGVVLKTYTRKRKSTEQEPMPPPKKSVVATATIKSEDGSYVTKSSRVIKRKVIWDPDETPSLKSPLKSPKLETVKSPPVKTTTTEKKEPANEKTPEKKVAGAAASPVKKVVAKSPPIKKPKRLTEVDKLLMDEGAVNMIYDVKTNDDASPRKKNNKSMISLDKAHKELMSKTSVIKNDLVQNTSKEGQKSLRQKKDIVSSPTSNKIKEAKKEVTPGAVTRKKSKDSVRSSVHSPPSSPAYNAAEASRIIRRHSSSSFSSNDDEDDGDDEGDEEKERVPKKKSSESLKKKSKKVATAAEAKPPKETAKNNNNTVAESKVKENHVDKTYKAFTVTKKNQLVAIKLQSVEAKCYLNEQVLKDLILCLKDSGKDKDCHVVSITSDSNESFCEGLDYRLLVIDDEGVRKKKANEVASLVKEFLRCLLNFPKVLVAGIQGNCVGLGVTMLPLFDMVVASDTSTFSTPYSTLGCIPEAGFLLTVPHLSSNGLASELLYASQIIKADDAFRRGLVSRLCWPEKYQQELKTLLAQVATQSRETLVETKQQLRQNIVENADSALSSVSKVLVEYWTSPECQKNFAK